VRQASFPAGGLRRAQPAHGRRPGVTQGARGPITRKPACCTYGPNWAPLRAPKGRHPVGETDEFLTVTINSTLVSDLDVLSVLLIFAADKVKAGQLDGTLHDAQGNEVGWFGIRQPARRAPVDRELFERTAPKWNCVNFADGPHYLSTGPVPPRGDCLWCGASAADIRQASR
jgi:hypothetical protein